MHALRLLLHHPYYRAGSVASKLAANWASGVWAVIIIVRPYTIEYSAYPQLNGVLQARWVALLMLALAVTQTLWLFLRWPPLRFGSMGYGLMCFFWTTLLVLIAMVDGPVRAAPLACVSTVVILSAFAFVTNPRSGCDGVANK